APAPADHEIGNAVVADAGQLAQGVAELLGPGQRTAGGLRVDAGGEALDLRARHGGQAGGGGRGGVPPGHQGARGGGGGGGGRGPGGPCRLARTTAPSTRSRTSSWGSLCTTATPWKPSSASQSSTVGSASTVGCSSRAGSAGSGSQCSGAAVDDGCSAIIGE